MTWGYVGGVLVVFGGHHVYIGGVYWWKWCFWAILIAFRAFLLHIPKIEIFQVLMWTLECISGKWWITTKYWWWFWWLLVILKVWEVKITVVINFIAALFLTKLTPNRIIQLCSEDDLAAVLGTGTARLPAFWAWRTSTLLRHMASLSSSRLHKSPNLAGL